MSAESWRVLFRQTLKYIANESGNPKIEIVCVNKQRVIIYY